jgi:preprotein translocase subunit SecE
VGADSPRREGGTGVSVVSANGSKNESDRFDMTGMKDVQQFVEDVQTEMKRVTWPDREQLRNATAVILVFCVIIAIIIGLMDTGFSWFVRTFVGVLSG